MVKHQFPGGQILVLVRGDITKIPVDGIVNAANSRLAGGGGVDGAIHRAGGPTIMRELDVIRQHKGECPPGCVVVTTAGNLPAKYVIHAVGPIFQDGSHGEAETLTAAYRTSLEMAEERGLGSISFPSISTGAYGYPVEQAAEIAIDTAAAFLENQKPGGHLQEVVFVLFDERTRDAFAEVLEKRLGTGAQGSRM